MLFILTETVFQDFIEILGVFTDKTRAVNAFLSAAASERHADCWTLASWDDSGSMRRELQIRLGGMRPSEPRGVPVRHVPPKEGEPRQGHWEPVDPLTFDW